MSATRRIMTGTGHCDQVQSLRANGYAMQAKKGHAIRAIDQTVGATDLDWPQGY